MRLYIATIFSLLMLLTISAKNADAATVTVTGTNTASAPSSPTSGDFGRVLNAINNASPGDTIILTGTFQFRDTNGAIPLSRGIPINKRLIIRNSGTVAINGPGTANTGLRATAFNLVAGSDSTSISGLSFNNFEVPIIIDGPVASITIDNNRFTNVLTAVFGFDLSVSTISNNIVNISDGANSIFGGGIVVVNPDTNPRNSNNYTNNGITGPGRGLFANRAAGIVERSTQLSTPNVTGNVIIRFDNGLDFGDITTFLISNNTTRTCETGILITDFNPVDFPGFVPTPLANSNGSNSGRILNNTISANVRGLVIFNAENNTITGNQLSNNSRGYIQDAGVSERPTAANNFSNNTFTGNSCDLLNNDPAHPLIFASNTFTGKSAPAFCTSRGGLQVSENIPLAQVTSVNVTNKGISLQGSNFAAGSTLLINQKVVKVKGNPVKGSLTAEGLTFSVKGKKLGLQQGVENSVQVLGQDGSLSAEFRFIFNGFETFTEASVTAIPSNDCGCQTNIRDLGVKVIRP